jgi:predicted permease
VIESLGKPEVLAPVATSGIGAMFAAFSKALETSLPLQIGLAVLLVAAPIAVATWLVLRQRNVRRGD